MSAGLQRRRLWASLFWLAAVSAFDYVTGDVSISIFYLIPIYLAVWNGTRLIGVAMALACAVMMVAMAYITTSSSKSLVLWDDFMKAGFFIGITWLLSRLRESLEAQRALNEELDARVRDRTAQLELAANELRSFNYALAHHLRAPLRAVAGFSRLLQKDLEGELNGRQKDEFQRIRAGAARLDVLIDGLAAVSSLPIAEARRETVDLSGMVADIVEELRAAEPKRQVRVSIEEGLKAKADRRFLAAALRCLLQNAWKFTSGRGSATIEFGFRRDGAKAVYFIRDNGAGFDMTYSGRLFQPFQRLHKPQEYPGLGIGLTLAHQIISRHGGTIWAEARPDRGAIFYFTLEPLGSRTIRPPSFLDAGSMAANAPVS